MIKLGLLGHNINYSLSGKIYEFAFRSFGLAGSYSLINLAAHELSPFLSKAWNEGFLGLNLTTPYKALTAALLKKESLGSVNTLLRSEGALGWDAISTDGIGFTRALARLGCKNSQFKRLIILGAGGVLPSLLLVEIAILRRSQIRDQSLQGFGHTLSFHEWSPAVLAQLLDSAGMDTLVIQASSAPVCGDDLANFVGAFAKFPGVFVDLVYRTPSRLYYAARKRNLPCQDGLPMLIEQARAAQEIWLGNSVDFESLWDFLADFQTP